MTAVLHSVLNVTVPVCILVAVIMAYRLIFRKAPKWISCMLWAVVGLRLTFPFPLETFTGLLPKADIIDSGNVVNVFAPSPAANLNPSAYSTGAVSQTAPAPVFDLNNTLNTLYFVLWITGFVILLVAGAVSYIKMSKNLKASVKLKDGVYSCDYVDTAFILGIFRPKIYVPSSADETKLDFILAHENAHLKRHDHWWKPLGYFLLAVYWFNPTVWVAYFFLCRDIEFACDEKVIKNLSPEEIADYSQILLDCSKQTKMITVCPVAFGEVGVKQRIKSALSYKKPALWIIIAAIIASVAVAVCFTTNRKDLNTDFSPGIDYLFVMCNEENTYICYRMDANGHINPYATIKSAGLSNSQIDEWVLNDVAENNILSPLPVTELYGPQTDGSDLTGLPADIFACVKKLDVDLTGADTFSANKNMVFVSEYSNGKSNTHIYSYNNGLDEIACLENESLCRVYSLVYSTPEGQDATDGMTVFLAINYTYLKNDFSYKSMGYECSTAGYVILDTEETDTKKKIYALIEYGRFGFSNGFFINQSGGSNPAVITVDKASGKWKLDAPRDGTLYAKDIKKLFPGKLAYKASNPTEKQRKEMWEQMKIQAQSYLDSIGRSAEICHYSEIEHILFSDLGISTEVDNKISGMRLPYNQEIGNYERIEDGVRYVYQTDYDKTNKLIKFTKFGIDSGVIAEYIEINAETGDIIPNAAYPRRSPAYIFGNKAGEDKVYTTAAFTAAKSVK